jgi:hypothetical protein
MTTTALQNKRSVELNGIKIEEQPDGNTVTVRFKGRKLTTWEVTALGLWLEWELELYLRELTENDSLRGISYA